MSDTITAREFLVNTFNTSFLTPAELETIITAMELFAKGKCKEQRQLCYNSWKASYGIRPLCADDILLMTTNIINANEPQF